RAGCAPPRRGLPEETRRGTSRSRRPRAAAPRPSAREAGRARAPRPGSRGAAEASPGAPRRSPPRERARGRTASAPRAAAARADRAHGPGPQAPSRGGSLALDLPAEKRLQPAGDLWRHGLHQRLSGQRGRGPVGANELHAGRAAVEVFAEVLLVLGGHLTVEE